MRPNLSQLTTINHPANSRYSSSPKLSVTLLNKKIQKFSKIAETRA